jgi:hypothetical protein
MLNYNTKILNWGLTHSIDFSSNNIFFELFNLDRSSLSIDPSFAEIFIEHGFTNYDATANLNVPVDYFNKLFWLNLTFQDLIDNSYNFRYVIDPNGWNSGYTVAFSNAIVNQSDAINPKMKQQYIKDDVIRFFLKQITGSLLMNSLFINKEQLVNDVSLMDTIFHQQIINIFTTLGGSFSNPLDNLSIPNPEFILINSILGEDETNSNNLRRNILIEYIQTQLKQIYDNKKSNKYYIYGNTINGLGWYYPLYIDSSNVDLSGVEFHTIIIDSSYSETGITFYIPNNGTLASSHIPTDNTYLDYAVLNNQFFSVPFYYGDQLSIKITYYPKSSVISGKQMGFRSYKINLNMGLESITIIPKIIPLVGTIYGPDISNNSYLGNDVSMIFGNELNQFYIQGNGSNPGIITLFKNYTNDSFISPYNYYPTLNDISGISFDLMGSSNEYWFVTIYTRTYTDISGSYITCVPTIRDNDWNNYNLQNMTFIDNYSNWDVWLNLLKYPKNINTNYGYVDEYGKEQILYIELNTNTKSTGKIKNASITFKDGRIIQLLPSLHSELVAYKTSSITTTYKCLPVIFNGIKYFLTLYNSVIEHSNDYQLTIPIVPTSAVYLNSSKLVLPIVCNQLTYYIPLYTSSIETNDDISYLFNLQPITITSVTSTTMCLPIICNNITYYFWLYTL